MKAIATAVLLLCAAGCSGRKAEPQEAEPAPSAEEPSDVGVGDFIDYATGARPVREGERLKKEIEEIQSRRERELEKALGE